MMPPDDEDRTVTPETVTGKIRGVRAHAETHRE